MMVPWAEPGLCFTLHFEAFAVAVMQVCRSLTQAAELLELHWDSVQWLINQAVASGLARRTTEGVIRVSFDGKNAVALGERRPLIEHLSGSFQLGEPVEASCVGWFHCHTPQISQLRSG